MTLIINGAGLPTWIWDDVRRVLGDLRVAARPEGAGRATLRDYAEAAIRSAPPGRFAIIAHSAGGVIGAEVARLVPERVSAFLGVAAIIPEPGGSLVSALPAPQKWLLGSMMRLAGTRPPDSAIRRGLAQGLDRATTDRLIAEFAPESLGLYRDRTTRRPWSGRCGYISTGRDRELPPAVQRRCARHLGQGWRDHLDTGHLPMIEAPAALGGSIARFLAAEPAPLRS